MLKVLLADDDYNVRERIKSLVDWQAYGCEVWAELSDGERAFSAISMEQPDIMVTDIQMPYMDGLTLSRLVKKEYPDIEIIMITSYSEFECVKEAMHIGVAEYILKPVDEDELNEAVRKVSETARLKKDRAVLELENKNAEKESAQYIRNEFFKDVIHSGKTTAELISTARENDIDIVAMWYNVMRVKVVPVGLSREDSKSTLEAIDNDLAAIIDEKQLLIFDNYLEGKCLIFKSDSIENLTGVQNTYSEKIKNVLYKYDYIKFYGGIGESVDRIGDIRLSYEKACRAYAYSYLINENLIIDINEMEDEMYMSRDEVSISDIDVDGFNDDDIIKYLKFGEMGKTDEYVEKLFDSFGEQAAASNAFRRYIVIGIYFCVCEFLKGIGMSKSEIESPDITYEILQNENNSKKYVVNILEKAMAFRGNNSRSRYGDIVDEVVKYIDENYADDKLSLNTMAAHVNFSPNHLSMIFSQQTGQPLIKYLTNYRMAKAKELLLYTNKRSSEISTEVGYKDPHYFSYLFKKTQGMNPTQFRNSRESKSNDDI